MPLVSGIFHTYATWTAPLAHQSATGSPARKTLPRAKQIPLGYPIAAHRRGQIAKIALGSASLSFASRAQAAPGKSGEAELPTGIDGIRLQKSGSHWTPRWRKEDSNPRSLSRSTQLGALLPAHRGTSRAKMPPGRVDRPWTRRSDFSALMLRSPAMHRTAHRLRRGTIDVLGRHERARARTG